IDQPLRDIERASRDTPEEMWFCWSYPDLPMDAHEFMGRRVVDGVDLLPSGTVLAWSGSRFRGGLTLVGGEMPLPVIPAWFGAKVGKPRSRKVMQAQLEGFHQAQAILGRWNTRGWEDAVRLQRAQLALPAPAKGDDDG